MANLMSAIKAYQVRGTQFGAGGDLQDIVLGFPMEQVVNCMYLGDIDDSEAYKASTDPNKDDPNKSFWWCKQPFVGFAIAINTKSDDPADNNWNVVSVVGPSFVEGNPNLASGEYRNAQAEAENKDVFKVRRTTGKQTRNGYDPNKKVFKPA
jgi:hypothetical protein